MARRIAWGTLVAGLLVAAPAPAVVLDFEGLPTSPVLAGTQVPDPASVVTDQFRDRGVVFGRAGVSTGVAAVAEPGSLLPSSGDNSVAGLDAGGNIPGTGGGALLGDIHFRFVVPGTDTAATQDVVRFTIGDGGGDVDQFVLRAYDLLDAEILSRAVEGDSRFPVELIQPGMHRVEIDFLGTVGYSLDDLEVDVLQVEACDLRTSWLLSLEPPLDQAVLLFSDDVTCPGRQIPPDVLVDDFSDAPDQMLPDLLDDGRPLTTYLLECPCGGLLYMSKDSGHVRATFRR